MNTDQQKTHTLFGGAKINVILEDGSAQEWTVRQIRLREYQAGFKLIEDEFGLVGLACDVKRTVVETLSPDSFTEVYAKVEEVNAKGFFTYAARQRERAAEMLQRLPLELVAQAMAQNLPTSSMLSPHMPPPRA